MTLRLMRSHAHHVNCSDTPGGGKLERSSSSAHSSPGKTASQRRGTLFQICRWPVGPQGMGVLLGGFILSSPLSPLGSSLSESRDIELPGFT